MNWSIGAGLEEKGVVVTGAAGGIGREIVGAFAATGARVCAVDLAQDAVDEVVGALDDAPRHLAVGADLADLAAHEPVLRRVLETFGRLDVLAHAAAVLRRSFSVDEVTEDDWDFQVDVNLKATFFLQRVAARLMREQGRGGRIVNFSSQGWWTGGFGGSVVYCASKGGIVSMTRGLARTFAPDGITVNSVAPGGVDTPMLRSGMTDEQLDAFVATIPLGRLANPAELAGTVVFLASDHASYITGATINVSGGQLMY
jgi:NAD(P)-dependent dehydrogenase (short-subunit alcohol dehydrogenase family)